MRGVLPRLLVIASCVGGVLTAAQSDAASVARVIQPGARITIDGAGCTANWIYRGADELRGQQFVGTAGHCVSRVGQAVYLTDGPFPFSFARSLRIGKVAYVSHALDFALVRIARGNFRYVVPAMAGHPDIPQRVGTSKDVQVGDVCQFSGHGAGFDGVQSTEESRIGLLAYMSRTQQNCDGAVSNGDSGGPVADTTAGNVAIGIVDTEGVAVTGLSAAVGEGGVTLTALLDDAAGHGFPIRLRTVRRS